MRKVLGLAVGAAMVAAAPVGAAEWWFLTTTVHEDLLFIDAESILTSGNSKSFWVQMEVGTPKNNEVSILSYQKIDCRNRTNSYKKIVRYNEERAITRQSFYDFPKEEPIVPGTILDTVRSFVCSPTKDGRKDVGIGPFSMPPHIIAREYRGAAEAGQ